MIVEVELWCFDEFVDDFVEGYGCECCFVLVEFIYVIFVVVFWNVLLGE